MPGEIFDFEWFVNGAGYRLLRAEKVRDGGQPVWRISPNGDRHEGAERRWLIAANLPAGERVFQDKHYNPLSGNSCLFLAFAEIDPEPEKILAFANKYGLLGFEMENPVSGTMSLTSPAEFISMWKEEITTMQRALDLWRLVEKQDIPALTESLAPYMRWIEADTEFRSGNSTGAHDDLPRDLDPKWLRYFRMNPHCLDWFRTGNVLLPARCRVQAVVNEQLTGRTSPRVLWDDAERSRWGLYFVPNSLAGALWLQMAQAITLKRDYRRCRQCNTWFEIDHYTARTNRYFCSNACRSKAYRDRQIEARRLFDQGMEAEEIADQLGSDTVTVWGWVNRGNPRE